MDVERRRHFADALDQLREVVGLGSRGRLEDHRVATQGLFAAPVGLVQGLGGVDAADFGVLFCVFGRVRLARQPIPPPDEEVLQVGARFGVQRVEHLVELHRVGRLRDRQRRPRRELRGRGAARLQFDEPVPFQEDPRADLDGRVRVDGKPPAFDFHVHDAHLAFAPDRADLADVHAGDAHRRLGVHVDGRVEHRFQLEAVFERDVLGEAEVHGERDDHDEHDREAHGIRAAQLDDRDFVVAAPQATAGAAHLRPPFPFALRRLLALFGWCDSPRSLSVEAGYFSPYKFCSRVVSSRLVLTLAGGRLPTTALPFS